MSEVLTFFDHQEIAKRRSAWAMIGFALTILLTTAAFSIFGGFVGLFLYNRGITVSPDDVFRNCALVSAIITVSVIFLSWAWKASILGVGPENVMKSLRAWPVPPDTKETDQRRLLNLVEEMSIASGLPIPDVYIIDSTAINACAVGMEVDQAAIAVTRGAIVKLNREELQGVIAHEFSHILYGDTALNTHMIAWLAGLFTISELGRSAMEGAFVVDLDFDREDSGPNLFFIVVGCGLWLLGAIGVFFGKALQSTVCRQREYLADASAIEYTRNPDGLGNALRKLGHHAARGRMVRPPNDCEHMMFSQIRFRPVSDVLSTHPPISLRIKRVLPSWDGSYLKTMELRITPAPSYVKPPPRKNPTRDIWELPTTLMFMNVLKHQQIDRNHLLNHAFRWKESLSPLIVEAAHNPSDAPLLIYALLSRDLLQNDPTDCGQILGEDMLSRMRDFLSEVKIHEEDRLGILDLSLPALRQLPGEEKPSFLKKIRLLCKTDGKIDLFEFCMQKLLEMNLREPGSKTTYQRMRVHISELENEINVMLSCLSRLGSDLEEDVERSFAKAEERMFGFTAGIKLRLLPAETCGLQSLDNACEKLPGLVPNVQQRLLLAGLAAIAEDDVLHFPELQAFRAFAAVMRIPVPPGLGLGNSGLKPEVLQT